MSTTALVAIVAGSLMGLGFFLLVTAHRPSAPSLAVLAAGSLPDTTATPWTRWKTEIAARLVRDFGAHPPEEDLRIMGMDAVSWTSERLAVSSAVAVVPLATLPILAVSGLSSGFILPLGGALVAAATVWLIQGVSLKRAAAQQREAATKAVAFYLQLVSMKLVQGSGWMSALTVSPELGGWFWNALRDEIQMARDGVKDPAEALREVAQRFGLPLLGSAARTVSTAMRNGVSSAEILDRLTAHSEDQLLAETKSRQQKLQEALTFPTMGLATIFLVSILLPGVLQLS